METGKVDCRNMKYSFNEQKVTYSQIEDLVTDIIDNLNIGSADETSISVVLDEKNITELFVALMKLNSETMHFTLQLIDIDAIDYDDLYYFSVCNNGSIYIEKACNQKYSEECPSYLYLESDIVFLSADNIHNDDLMKSVKNNNLIIFNFS
jgi:hypothetical protein